ncbi:MAG: tetratricopeptide repeat protein [Burkholderiaceae bacterium]|nr:tetratricopeptide repeat protein [Burkholderiaceae bacterium]
MTAQVLLNGFTLDIERAELRAPDGKPVAMRAQSMAVLLELAKRHGELVTKQDLFARVWPGVSVTDDSLVQCVVEIRRALGDSGQQVVRTLPRRGYTLTRSDEQTSGPSASAEGASSAVPAGRFGGSRWIPVAVAAVVLAVGGWWWSTHNGTALRTPTASASLGANLAILPLRAMPWQAAADGPSAGAAPDGDGLAWLIAGELASNPEMRVTSPIASAALAREGLSAGAIGRRLGVNYVVDGSVARRADRLRLAMQLVDARDDAIAWTWQFEATAQQLPQAADELVVRVGRSLGASVRELRKAEALRRAPATLDVVDRVARGIALKHRLTPASLQQARQEFEEAIRQDPQHAPAWLYLGWVKSIAITNRADPQLGPADLPSALNDVRHAIELDPTVPAAWQGLAVALVHSGRYAEAVVAAERSVAVGPGDPDNWLFLGWALQHAGRAAEGLLQVEKALAWNPIRPAYYPAIHARVAYAAGRYEDALKSAHECIDRTPAIIGCKALWLSASMRLGRAAAAQSQWPGMLAAAPALRDLRQGLEGVDRDLDTLRASADAAR